MSGGSYNYLCYKEPMELHTAQRDLEDMAERLTELGYANDAAQETYDAILTLRQIENRLTTIQNRMEPVWKAVEWMDSGDSTEKNVKQALKEYRSEDT